MTKLVVFGDSFASPWKTGQGFNWMEHLSQYLGLDLQCFGKSGSSTNFSAHQLVHYLESNEYSIDDIIVFVFSSRVRSRLINKDFDPGWAGDNRNFVFGSPRNNHPAEDFYKKYLDYFKLELELTDNKDYEVERFKTAMALKQLPNLTVLVSAFGNVVDFKGKPFLLADTDTAVLIDADLYTLSLGEFLDKTRDKNFQSYYNFFKGEHRNCHLSKTNNTILANLLYDCIRNKSREYFDPTQFKQHFLGLSEDYEAVYKEELGPEWIRYKDPVPSKNFFAYKKKT